MSNLRDDWNTLKRLASISPAHLRALAFSPHAAGVNGLPLQSLRWRLYLDVLPIENFGEEDDECQRVWSAIAEKERKNYDGLRSQYVIDPSTVAKPEQDMDWKRMNPLSLDEDSPWFQYHKDQELRTTIMQDVARTFPEEEYFRQPHVQKTMCDILFVYAKVHSSLQYRQGMHELLGPLLMVVDRDAVGEEQCTDNVKQRFFLDNILSNRFIEHDTFAMFDRLMRLCLPWYQSPSFTSPPLRPARRKQGTSKEDKQAAIDAMKAHTPIIAQCYMMMEKLETVDPRLALHLQTLDIEPQLFGIRWYRLLFSREFTHLEDVLVLWGMLFADNHGGPLRLVDWIGVVLLLANRRPLLLGDYADNLNTLLHLPPLPSPTQYALEQTPPLSNSPLSPNQYLAASPGASDMPVPMPKIPYAAMTQHGMMPIQRLALQAAYLRSRPSPETATLITSQYEVWEEEAWDVIEETEALKQGIVDGARRLAVGTHKPETSGAKQQNISSSAVVGGGHSVASAPIAVTWQGRKMYTSNTLQHRRANGYGGTSPRSPKSSSPSSPLIAARMAAISEPRGNDLQSQPESPNQIPMDVVSPTESNDGRTPAEAVRALGSVTAQVSTMAAQCVDLIRIQEGTASKAHLDVLGAALHMVSQVWQDEVVRSSSTSLVSQQQGLRILRNPSGDMSSPGAQGIRSRKMSEADLRVVLRDLDRVYVELSNLKQ
ncbi:hypothetical protein EV178_002498 [Coemansia sp. RSA 1646]|nr:hypothetical protein EV178_002498 [Coemansia sp. RSA 1646]KAJ1771405.1 hypothetical protein LPJ74_002335 [Coemansia sp. RSA 1843]KAJ2089166.1 hypothetical protein IW138_003626 [Coemansia sp. RSA 986]KAJ2213775.1 hypothetical protein EV179_003577 [Coemansia sp. RSA 487]